MLTTCRLRTIARYNVDMVRGSTFSYRSEQGSTLLDVVVGSALMTLVFVGIVGAFQLAVDAVSNNKARAGAIALATEQLEYIRSLSYDSIGTLGGIPAGLILQTATTTLNDVNYTRRTFISYEDDPGDGVGVADSNAVVVDYKAAKVAVSWNSRQGTRTITMVTRISPPTGIEVDVPGGTIVIHVVDASFQPVSNAEVEIINDSIVPPIDVTTYTDTTGTATLLGVPAGAAFQVTVTKAGYSTAQTYGATATNTNPLPSHLGVALYQTTASTFEIDQTASLTIETYELPKEETWSDSFVSDLNISTTSAVVVESGSALLEGAPGSYPPEGLIVSNALSVPYLSLWKELAWDDSESALTSVSYQVFDANSNLIPDASLPGNAAGFTDSPISLVGVSTSTYSMIRVGAKLSSTDVNETPSIRSWSVVYEVGAEPLANQEFTIQGAKVIGSGVNGALIYKFDRDLNTDAEGVYQLNDIEWDLYSVTIPALSGYDIASSCAPQPLGILPATSVVSRLYLTPHTTNSLLVDVKASDGTLIQNATVRLYRQSYDTSLSTDACGQIYFGSLAVGTVGGGSPYSIEVSAPGYTSFTSSEVNVSGTARLSVILN